MHRTQPFLFLEYAMSIRSKLLFSVAVLMLQSGCASTGSRQDAVSAEPQYEGIRTRPINAAPATQPANNTSRPLSQQNTPTAVAAREAAARNNRVVAPVKTPASAPVPVNSANPGLAAFLAAAANAAPVTPPQSKAFQTGAKVQVKSGTALYAQPNKASQTTAIAQSAELELGPQMYNAGGHWWYVTAGKESGWLLQADIAR